MSRGVVTKLASLLVAAGFLAQAQAKPPAELPDPPEALPFEFSIRPQMPPPPGPLAVVGPTVQIQPGGRVRLVCELKYTGDTPLTILGGRTAWNKALQLTIQTPLGGKMTTSAVDPPPQPHQAAEDEIVTLQPGETVRGQISIGGGSSGRHEFYFREPGRYSITASLSLYEASGDPQQPDSWTMRGRIVASEVSFAVQRSESDAKREWRRIFGRITDENAQPVPQADVHLLLERTSMSSVTMEKKFRIFDRAVTDDKGRFEFRHVPAAEPRLMIGVLHRLHPPGEKIVAVDPAADQQQVDLSLPPGRTVSGTVVDTEGRPLAGVQIGRPFVSWKYLQPSILTAVGGKFTLQGLPTTGTYVQAHRRDLDVADRSNFIAAGSDTVAMTIVMQPRSASTRTFTGIARFENGQPARNLELTFWIDRQHSAPTDWRVVTDGHGRFSHEVRRQFAPDNEPLTGLVEASPPSVSWDPRTGHLHRAEPGRSFSDNHVPRNRWMTRLNIPAGQNEITLRFNRRHTLDLRLNSAAPLPEALKVNVSLAAKVGYNTRQVASETLPGHRLTDLDYRDLTAGTYRVQVRFDPFNTFHWEEELTIPFEAARTRHEISIDIPEIGFGSLKIPIHNADGSKLDEGLSPSVVINGHIVRERQPAIDGVATWPLLPAGKVSASYEGEGVLALAVQGEVRAGEETVLDPLIIRPEKQVFGYVSGRVLTADGTPALGARVHLTNIGFFGSVRMMPAHLEGVDGDGGFALHALPRDQAAWLQVFLSGCDLWPVGSATDTAAPPTGGFSTSHRNSQHRSLIVPTTLAAGNVRTQDIILPDATFRDVTIEVPLEDGQHAGVMACTDLGQAGHLRTEHFVVGETLVLHHVPDRPTRLFLRVWSRKYAGVLEYAGVLNVPDGESPHVRIDPAQTGVVQIQARLPEESQIPVWWSVRLEGAGLPRSLASLAGPFSTKTGQATCHPVDTPFFWCGTSSVTSRRSRSIAASANRLTSI